NFVILRGPGVLLEALRDEVHAEDVAREAFLDAPVARELLGPPAIGLRRMRQDEIFRLAGYIEIFCVLAEVVVEEAVDPDSSALEPQKLVCVRARAVVIQAAHEPTVFVIDAKLI